LSASPNRWQYAGCGEGRERGAVAGVQNRTVAACRQVHERAGDEQRSVSRREYRHVTKREGVRASWEGSRKRSSTRSGWLERLMERFSASQRWGSVNAWLSSRMPGPLAWEVDKTGALGSRSDAIPPEGLVLAHSLTHRSWNAPFSAAYSDMQTAGHIGVHSGSGAVHTAQPSVYQAQCPRRGVLSGVRIRYRGWVERRSSAAAGRERTTLHDDREAAPQLDRRWRASVATCVTLRSKARKNLRTQSVRCLAQPVRAALAQKLHVGN
jgi:hypothetical protein